MELSELVQYGTGALVLYALYEILYKNARWRTQADIKLEAIDVNWKPQVNQRLDSHDDQLSTLNKSLIEQNREILQELRTINKNINSLAQSLALAVQAREFLEGRVDKFEAEQKGKQTDHDH